MSDRRHRHRDDRQHKYPSDMYSDPGYDGERRSSRDHRHHENRELVPYGYADDRPLQNNHHHHRHRGRSSDTSNSRHGRHHTEREHDSKRHAHSHSPDSHRRHRRSSAHQERHIVREDKWRKGLEAAAGAAAIELFRTRKEPNTLAGKGARIATAALGAAVIESTVDKRPAGEVASKWNLAESTVGGLLVNRIVNGSRKETAYR